jgi:DNA repair protein RadC
VRRPKVYHRACLYPPRKGSPLVSIARALADMPTDDRPRERLLKYGAGALTNTELLAILLNTGTSTHSVVALADLILSENGGFTGLMRLDANELARLHGIGPAKATKLKASMEIANRVLAARIGEQKTIKGADDVFDLLGLEMSMLEEEQLRIVLLNTRSELLGVKTLYQGSTNLVPVRIAEILREAIRVNAPAMVIVHNHPSGDPTPSAQDISLNLDIEQACILMGIKLMDHVIIGQGRCTSLRRLGIGFAQKESASKP